MRAGYADRSEVVAAIRGIGVTRLSLGVENFDDQILELNGRAHRSPEIGRAYEFARSLDFPQINIDLIAGMLGETDDNWQRCIDRTLELSPDSVTVYQMELPYNTTISGNLLKGTGRFAQPVADWPTKRRWVREAFEALDAGYHVRSALTAVKDPQRTRFIYTDRLWQGADMVGLGVASFGHVNGVHAELRHVGDLLGCGASRRNSFEPRVSADRRGTLHPRVHPAVEARIRSRRCISARSIMSTCSIGSVIN